MNPLTEALGVLRERRNWLTQRAQGKANIGWDTTYDLRERDALTTVLQHHGEPPHQPVPGEYGPRD